jgi:thiol-disulfide isomerase/thioredoxin
MLRLIVSTLCVCLAGAAPIALADAADEVEIGATLRDATMRGLNGPFRNLSEFRGKPLIINVWASWCGPCRAEMASLERLAWLERSSHFNIIGISTDDYVDQARAALEQSNATITHFIDTELRMEKMLGASRFPLTVLVDANGRVLDKIYGAREWDGPVALRLIDRAFQGEKPESLEPGL